MADISSLTARMALAVQNTKGTAPTYGFMAGLLTRSQMGPTFDVIDPGNEHPGGADRNTSKKSASDRFSYLINVAGSGNLYPNLVGTLLRGAGFDVSSTDQTTYQSHAFTIADAADVAYLSAIHRLGTSSDEYERLATDIRISRINFNIQPRQATMDFAGSGLDEEEAAGDEDVTAEENTKIIGTAGSLTFTIGGVAFTSEKVRSATVTIEQVIDTEDYALWTTGRVDVPQTSIRVFGTLSGINALYPEYKKINWGGTSGTGPSLTPTTGAMTLKWQSAANISGAAVPFSIQFAMGKVEANITNPPEANGDDKVRFDLDWEMIDDTTTPLTVTLHNEIASYAYQAS